MRSRYARAVDQSPPKLAANTVGAAVEGHWLSPDQFYFIAEQLEASSGRPRQRQAEEGTRREAGLPLERGVMASGVRRIPMVAHCERGVVEEVSAGDEGSLLERPSASSHTASALISPDGRYGCFLLENDVWLRELGSGVERPLTTGGAAEDYFGRGARAVPGDRTRVSQPPPVGLWSADSQWFLTHRIDERNVPDLALLQHAPRDGGRPVAHVFKYPMPGDPLPVATMVAIHVESGRVLTFSDFPLPVLGYSPFSWRMVWFGDADRAWLLRVDRYWKHAELIRLDLAQGTGRVAVQETVSSGYIDFHHVMAATPNVRMLSSSNEVIWYSEADGWGHLYLYDADTGRLKNRVTGGDWLVRDIVHVDEQRRRILFLASGLEALRDPAHRALCAVNLDGSGFEVLLQHDGDLYVDKTAGISPDGQFAVVRYSSFISGNRTDIVNLTTRRSFTIARCDPAPGERPPQRFTVLAADGITTLHGVMILPQDFDASRSYPLIDHIYPGPQIAHQPQSFRAVKSGYCRSLAELGVITIMLDTRGMPFRSRALHQAGYGHLLEPQLADHAAAVQQLCARHSFIDSSRVGIFGNSGGGAAAARALFDYADIFKVGVSVCGNHDSSYNSAMWSDKYRGPGDADQWAEQANSAAAHKLRGKLLLISGDMDDTVHVGHTVGLVQALIRANRDFDLLIVPNEGHLVLMRNGYVQRRMWDYFVKHLLGEQPPTDFPVHFQSEELARCERAWMREVWE
jgi:dipeptidyl-peptidase 4